MSIDELISQLQKIRHESFGATQVLIFNSEDMFEIDGIELINCDNDAPEFAMIRLK